MTKPLRILCVGTSYVSRFIAAAFVFMAIAATADFIGMAAQARREG
jgi:hypothetical protein